MIEKVLSKTNMLKACHQVVSNKGSAGVDGMTVTKLSDHWEENQQRIATSVCNGKYLPQAILGVEIPKSNEKTRLLGIPTVTDRLLQQAVHQLIMPLFEAEFREHSYGFRPNRNAHQSVLQAQSGLRSQGATGHPDRFSYLSGTDRALARRRRGYRDHTH